MGDKPRLLDLFAGAGGAAMGYHRAGLEVVGVDIKPQKNYPFEFHQDGSQFDSWLRTLTTAHSRRGALTGLLAGSLGLAGLRQTGAKRHKKKHKKRGGSPPAPPPLPPVPPSPPSPPAPTCSDGLKNGSETDVDCGGSCPRCESNRACSGRADCISGRCVSHVCQACDEAFQCGSDGNGPCNCYPRADDGTGVCVSNGGYSYEGCDQCPPGWGCTLGPPLGAVCWPPCEDV